MGIIVGGSEDSRRREEVDNSTYPIKIKIGRTFKMDAKEVDDMQKNRAKAILKQVGKRCISY